MTTEYQPWKGRLDDGTTEVLVSVYVDAMGRPNSIDVAFRDQWDRTWQAPVHLERAP